MFGPIFNILLNLKTHEVNNQDKNCTVEDQAGLKVDQNTQNNKESTNGLNNQVSMPPLFKIPHYNLNLIH